MNKRETQQFKKEMDELKPGEGVVLDDKTKYEYGADLNAESSRIEDAGTGNTVLIRIFDFKMNPGKFKDFPTDTQIIFNSHVRQIATTLWGDGLRPLEEVPPRVIINKKAHSYKIFVTCEAKRGLLFSQKDQPLPLQTLINQK